MYTTLWTFKTRNFTIELQATPCQDLDLFWDEAGETADKIESGVWKAFDARVVVLFRGAEVGADYLGQCIYEDPAEFRDHIGVRAKGYGSYFSDMVRQAIQDARNNMRDAPRLRA